MPWRIAELATTPGIAGVHLMAPANEAALPDVIAAARTLLNEMPGTRLVLGPAAAGPVCGA